MMLLLNKKEQLNLVHLSASILGGREGGRGGGGGVTTQKTHARAHIGTVWDLLTFIANFLA